MNRWSALVAAAWFSPPAARANPEYYTCDFACMAAHVPGAVFTNAPMGIPNFGAAPTEANCMIAADDVPAGGFVDGQEYSITITSTTALAHKVVCNDHAAFSAGGGTVVDFGGPGNLVLTSTHAFTPSGSGEVVFHALCGAGGATDEMWVADALTVARDASQVAPPCGGTLDLSSDGWGGTLEIAGEATWTCDSDSIDVTVTFPRSTWVAYGFSNGDAFSMGGGGFGSSVVACQGDPPEVVHYWFTAQSLSSSGGVVAGATCTRDAGSTTLTFQQPLQPATPEGSFPQIELSLNDPQRVIYAFGAADSHGMAYHGINKGGAHVDLSTGELATTTAAPTLAPTVTEAEDGGGAAPGEAVAQVDLTDDGLGAASWTLDEESITMTVTFSLSTWIAFGFSSGDVLSMGGGGDGSDVVVCYSDPPVVKRYWLTSYAAPSGGVDVAGAACTREGGTTILTFQRPLAKSGNQIAVTPGTSQPIIYAYGEANSFGLVKHQGTSKGGSNIDFASGAQTEAEKKSAEVLLLLHMICMTVCWGGILPWGVAIASRTRKVVGQPEGGWFKRHRMLQSIGLVGMLLGFLFIVLHIEDIGAVHFNGPHTFIGIIVIAVGALQPLNALIRPHAPKEGEQRTWGRLAFEVVHKGGGYFATIFGILNIVSGILFLNNLNYNTATLATAVTLAVICMWPAQGFFVLSTLRPNNAISRVCVGAKKGGGEQTKIVVTPQNVGNAAVTE